MPVQFDRTHDDSSCFCDLISKLWGYIDTYVSVIGSIRIVCVNGIDMLEKLVLLKFEHQHLNEIALLKCL